MRTVERDVITPPSLDTLLRPVRTFVRDVPRVEPLSDRRAFVPDRSVSPVPASRRDAARVVAPATGPMRRLAFNHPRDVSICRRRKQRKEVLFAEKIAGQGGVGRGKKRRTNFWSTVSCK